MAFTIITKNKEKTFTDCELVNICTKEGFDFLIQKCHLFIPYSTFEKLIIKYPEIAQLEPNLIKNYRNISKLNPYFDDSHFCNTILENQPQLNTILEKEK